MNILHTVEFYPPSVGGVEEVVKQLSEHLVKLGHHVTIATTKLPNRKFTKLHGVKIVEFDITGNLVKRISGERQKYIDYVLNSKFDVITNFAAQQWATDLLLPVLDKIKAKKVFVPTGFSGFYSPFYKNYFNKMKEWMKEYDASIFLSGSYRDIDFARKNNIRNIKIIPNGASKEEFTKKTTINIRKILNIPDDHFLILDVGSHTGLKGHLEAIRIFSQAKIKRATFLIIGRPSKNIKSCYRLCKINEFASQLSPNNLKFEKRILIRDLTRPQTVAAFKASDLFLFTSRIECSPIVLFESLAAKTPFLTTDVGNAKEIINWTRGGKLLPTTINCWGYSQVQAAQSAKILEDCYHHRPRLSLMRKRGHTAWLKKFTWEKIANKYESLYESLIHS